MKRLTALLLLVAATTIFLNGCDLLAGITTPVDPIPAQDLQLILEAHWELFAMGTPENLVGPIEESRITLDFTADGSRPGQGTLSGSAGCNSFTTSFNIGAFDLKLGAIASTKMACPEPAGVMDQETRFLQALSSVIGYELNGGQLDLIFGLGGERLFFIGALP